MRQVNGIEYRQGFAISFGEKILSLIEDVYDCSPTKYIGSIGFCHAKFTRGSYGMRISISFGLKQVACAIIPMPITDKKRAFYMKLGEKYKDAY